MVVFSAGQVSEPWQNSLGRYVLDNLHACLLWQQKRCRGITGAFLLGGQLPRVSRLGFRLFRI